MKKAILFDLDGTLLDTLNDLTNAVNFALCKFGYERRSLTYVKNAIGDGVETLIKRCIPSGIENKDYLDVLSSFKNHYAEHFIAYTFPYRGVKQTLLALKGHGYKLGVVTNKVDSLAIKLIDKFFYGIFDVVVGSRSTRRKKPHPEMLNIALKSLGDLSYDEAIYIGDTDVDYKLAEAANMDLIFVSYGYRDKKYLNSIDDSIKIIDDICELRKILIK